MKKLRLLLFEECNKYCKGCCNRDWDLKALPEVKDFHQYDEILLTGGEPMLNPYLVICVAARISRQNPVANIYLYTAETDNWQAILSVLHYIDGLTVTLHEQSDVDSFIVLNNLLSEINDISMKSFRLNVFKGVNFNDDLGLWKVKDNIEWIKNCPLPQDEVFMRLNDS